MSALSHLRDYLKQHFAGHDIDTQIQHLETAIEAKVEEAVADLKQEIAELREELPGGRPSIAVPAPVETAEQPAVAETGSAA